MDFDLTLTTRDTVSALASAAYSLHDQRHRLKSQLPPWAFFSDTYISDYRAHSTSYGPRTNTSQEFTFLTSLSSIERASIARVESHGVFANLPIQTLITTGVFNISLREGAWDNVLTPALNAQIPISVLSVNWSRLWIQEALRTALKAKSHSGWGKIRVYCNDLIIDGEGITTGQLTRWFKDRDEGIWTAEHKWLVMQEIVEGRLDGVVYVGDSSTDLMCLYHADIGIVIGNDLDKTCERIGLPLVTLEKYEMIRKEGKKALLKVTDLRELGMMLGFVRSASASS